MRVFPRLGLHPVIIISTKEVYEAEGLYGVLMITSTKIRDNFSFELSNEKLIKPLEKLSQVRCKLIAMLSEKEMEYKVSELKEKYFVKLIKQFNKHFLGI